MHASLLLALPVLLAAAQPHSPRAGQPLHPHLAAPREVYEPRAIPKAHLGFPPSKPADVLNVAGMGQKRETVKRIERIESKREGFNLVRRKKKRSCAAQQTVAVGPASTSSPVDTSSDPATSTTALGQGALASASASASAAPAASSAASDTSGNTSVLRSLFPLGEGSADWTTSPLSPSAMSFNAALKPLTAGKLPSSGTAPDGSNALVANYPAGTFQLSGSGYSFYTEGEQNGVVVEGANEVMFSYSVFFPEGFQFVKGGKMPGLYGGTSLAMAKSCSGGRQDNRDQCFSARLMWRTNGMGEIYNYLPAAAYDNKAYCSTAPMSLCDTTYGDSIGRGAYTWATGQWTTVAQRLKMNDYGQSNGEQELFVNGESVLNLTGMTISVEQDTKIYGIMAQTFFGGNDASWASPTDQSVYFKDWSLAVMA